jgi:uncharacterized protein YjbI with pentapeptide repeats
MNEPLTKAEVVAPDQAETSHKGVQIEPDEDIVRQSLTRCTLAGTHLRLTLRDLTLETCDLRNSVLDSAVGSRLVLRECQLVGVDISGGSLRDAVFINCQIKLGRAFGAMFERCWFEGCDLREAEFEESKFDRVTFRGCDLRGSRLLRSPLRTVDFRGSRVDGIAVSPDLLAGAVIAGEQADVFAAAMGLKILPMHPEGL